jgi:hypothetical protein
MIEEFISIKKKVEEFFDSAFLSTLDKNTDEQIIVINNIRDLIKIHLLDLKEALDDESKFYKEIENYNTRLLSILQENSIERNSSEFSKDFSELIQDCSRLIEHTDSMRTEEQDDDRFRMLSGDKFSVKLIKLFKIPVYVLTTFPRRILNLFRKLFHRQPLAMRKWKRKVNLQDLIRVIVIDNLLFKSLDLIDQQNKNLTESYQKIWKSEEEINKHFTSELQSPDLNHYFPDDPEIRQFEDEFDLALNIMRKNKEDTRRKFREDLDEVFAEFDSLYLKAGTIEFPKRLYTGKVIEKFTKIIEGKYKKLSKGWGNTLYCLFEDWKFNKDIYRNEILEVQELVSLKKEITHKVYDRIGPEFDEIKRVLNACKLRIENDARPKEWKNILLREKAELSKLLDGELIINTAELLIMEGITETIDELEVNFRKNIEKTFVKRAIVKIQDYSREIRDSEIEYIDPQELIKFEILPEFLRDIQKLKTSVVEQVDNVQKELLNIGQIADFNLESAIASIEFPEEEKQTESNPGAIASEGLQRAISKTDELKSALLGIKESVTNSASQSVASCNEKTLELTKTDNIFEIRLRIAKAKAIEKSVEYRKKTVQSLKQLIPGAITYLKKAFINTGNIYKNIRLSLGLEKKPTKISAEISDFLTESENAINKLPYVYQRLFRIEPLEEEKFYEPRIREVENIELAINNWRRGHYAPVVIVGEKGSGITTTVNLLKKNVIMGEEVIHMDARKTTESEKDLLRLFSPVFNSNFTDYSQIIKYLNSSINKKIIILENVHHLFIRTVGGFRIFKSLFEIISSTNSNIFWIVTSNLYAWNYFERVLNIGDYFSYIIKLLPFTDEQIVEIILKRNRVSGFNINFEPSAEDLKNKNFLKLNDPERQKYLKEKYFSELNRFARSNLSISLYFWMRSTREVKNDIITIGSLEGLDFSFLQDLSEEKIFTLYALLIHDGLNVEQHALVFNQSEEKSRLNLLLLTDDGIITKTKNGYMINPLLYRQTVSLLQSKNILH